jgi:hypothetical protein
VRLALTAAARAWATARVAAGRGTRQRQAAGLTEKAVAHILASYGADGPRGVADKRDVAILLVARDLLARRSELVAVCVEDLQPGDDGGATVAIRRSKTDQLGEGATAYLGPEAYDALRAWLDAAGITSGPAFRAVSAHGRVGATALHAHKVTAVLKKLAHRAAPQLRRLGIDPAQVSGHSGRVGWRRTSWGRARAAGRDAGRAVAHAGDGGALRRAAAGGAGGGGAVPRAEGTTPLDRRRGAGARDSRVPDERILPVAPRRLRILPVDLAHSATPRAPPAARVRARAPVTSCRRCGVRR